MSAAGLSRRRTLTGLSLCALATILVRLPLIGLPPSPDEGGYASVAHRWALGGRLYGDAWVDRPQGLILLFRAVVTISYTPLAVRCAAIGLALALTVAAGSAAWAVAGRTAALVAAAITAVVAAGPFVEGYALNGELAGAAVGTAGAAAALWWRRTESSDGRLLAVGAVLCGLAPLMKQSALDALVLLAFVVLAGSDGRRRHALLALAGAVAPVTLAIVDASARNWSQWWFAVVTFQTTLAAGTSPADRVVHVVRVLVAASPDVGGLFVVAVVGAVTAKRAGPGRVAAPMLVPVMAWAVAAAVGAMAGPFSHEHYWIQAVAPMAVLASACLDGTDRLAPLWRRRATAVMVTALLVPALTQAVLVAQSPQRRFALVLNNDRQRRADPMIAAWLRRRTAPGDSVYAFVASSDLYLLADRGNDYPYVWRANVEGIPGALQALQTWLDGSAGPHWVVVYQKPDAVDPSGTLASVLATRYHVVTTIDGYPVLERST